MKIDMTRWTHPLELGERRFLHPGPLRWLRALGCAVALFFLIALASLSTGEALGKALPKTSRAAQRARPYLELRLGVW